MTFQAWKMKFLNSITFQVFHDLYKPWEIYFQVALFRTLHTQHAKKVVSDSPGLVDFAIGLVIFVLNLPDGQVLFFGEIQITEEL